MRLFLHVTTLAVLASCVPTNDVMNTLSKAGCRDENDCPKNLTCNAPLCTDDAQPEWPLLLRFLPPVNSAAGEGEMDNVVFGEKAILDMPDVRLPVPVEVIGSARLPNGTSLPVSVTARAESATYPRLSYVGETTDDVNGPRFALRLPAVWPSEGASLLAVIYRLNVVPKETDRYPPWTITPFQVPTEGGRINLDLPDPDTMVSYSATIVQNEVTPVPIAGLRAYAVDGDGRTISTDVRTDQLGQFTIRFWAVSAGLTGTLRIRPTVESGPYPALDLPLTVPEAAAPMATVDEMTNNIAFGDTGDIGWVSGTVHGNEFIAGARLHFRSEIGNGIYRYDVLQTNDEGQFQALLYPGAYTVDIIPPLDSRYRITRITETIEGGSTLNFRPQTRANVSGRILNAEGTPIPNAIIEATLVKASFADPRLSRANDVSPTRRQRVQTDSSGGYVLELDPGSHTLSIRPPLSSGLAVLTQRLDITALDTTVNDVDIQIPSASGLRLRLIAANNEGISGAVVEAWRMDKSPPELAARARTSDNGQVLLRLSTTQ